VLLPTHLVALTSNVTAAPHRLSDAHPTVGKRLDALPPSNATVQLRCFCTVVMRPADYEPTIQRSLSLEDDTMNENMNENIVTLADVEDDILDYEVADEALEASAGIFEGQAKNVTISFCSGLDTCPS
jgi:hypothetical protein